MWFDTKLRVGACLCVALVGCGDNGGGTNSASNSNSESQGSTQATESSSGGSMSATMTASEATEGGASLSGTGTTDQSGSMSDSQTNGGGSVSETDGATGGSTGQDSQGGSGGTSTTTTTTTGTTGEPVDCSTAASEDECLMLGCMPVKGQGFNFDGAIWCLKDNPSYLGCIENMACAEVITVVCKGQNKYQLPNACTAPGYVPCEAPPDPGMDGYPSCA